MTHAQRHSSYQASDFGHSPLMFYYEVTMACDLVCKHCRASAQEQSHPDELPTAQSKALLEQVATFPRKPTVVFTGGDPLKRADLYELIAHGAALGLQIALTPSGTPLATRAAFQRAKEAGVTHLGISLDGPDAASHDEFRGWSGSFARTMEMLDYARDLQMLVQVNTSLTCRNVAQLDAMAALLATKGIAVWSVFFLVPVGRGLNEQRISADACETVFAKLYGHSQHQPYAVKTVEAPHYRRFILEQGGDPQAGRMTRAPLGITDGKGIMFVDHTGAIFPAGFLPLACGRFPNDSVVEVYQRHPTFLALRDVDHFRGKCGYCEYRHVCGGSRSRAYALTGDPLETDPDCAYVPAQPPRDAGQ
jgi:AdoMet-dependent heme synthase